MKSMSLEDFRVQCDQHLSFLVKDHQFKAGTAHEHRLSHCYIRDYQGFFRVGVVYGRDDFDIDLFFLLEPYRSWPLSLMPYRLEQKPIPKKQPKFNREDLQQQADILRSCLPKLIEIATDSTGGKYRAMEEWSISEAKSRYERDREEAISRKSRRKSK